jgi:hypothetical protein
MEILKTKSESIFRNSKRDSAELWEIQLGNETKRCQRKNIGPEFPFF